MDEQEIRVRLRPILNALADYTDRTSGLKIALTGLSNLVEDMKPAPEKPVVRKKKTATTKNRMTKSGHDR